LLLPCRPLALLDEGEAGLRAIAAALSADPGVPERPLWRGAAAETGPWTRAGREPAAPSKASAWFRLGARLADLAAIAVGEPLAFGAVAIGPGEAIGYSEMSRGLLLHWVRLTADEHVADCRVIAPTEWNFHPRGSLAQALREGRFDAGQARLAALALDPCIRFDVEEVEHA